MVSNSYHFYLNEKKAFLFDENCSKFDWFCILEKGSEFSSHYSLTPNLQTGIFFMNRGLKELKGWGYFQEDTCFIEE